MKTFGSKHPAVTLIYQSVVSCSRISYHTKHSQVKNLIPISRPRILGQNNDLIKAERSKGDIHNIFWITTKYTALKECMHNRAPWLTRWCGLVLCYYSTPDWTPSWVDGLYCNVVYSLLLKSCQVVVGQVAPSVNWVFCATFWCVVYDIVHLSIRFPWR